MMKAMAAALGFVLAAGAAQAQAVRTIELPPEVAFPEGIALNPADGSFYTAGAQDGAIVRVDAQGRARVVAPAGTILPAGSSVFPGVLGMKLDGGRLYVAGGSTGKMWVVDAASGKLLKTYETPAAPPAGLINDVVVAGGHAYFTDSFRPVLWRASAGRTPGELQPWLDFTGTPLEYGAGVNINGIAATPDGKTLFVVQMNKGLLFKIDVASKRVTPVDLKGQTAPGSDGLVIDGRTAYLVRQPDGEIVTVALAADMNSGDVVSRFKDPSFVFPATAAKSGDSLLVVNTQFNRRTSGPTRPFTVSRVPLAALKGK